MVKQEKKDEEKSSEKRDFLKSAWEKKSLKQWFKRDNLIVLILSGILLFIIALPTKNDSEPSKGAENGQSNLLFGDNKAVLETTNPIQQNSSINSGTEYDYVEYLEKRLEEALTDIHNVGKVKVMLTLQSSQELVVEKDTPTTRSNTNESDAEGGNRMISQTETQETTIYRTEGNSSEPYVIKTILPKVEGVLVVAQGAGSGSVNKSITEIVQALFDVEAHKVKVVPMEDAQ